MTGGVLAALATGVLWTVALTAVSFSIGAALGLGLYAVRVSDVPLFRFLAGVVILSVRSIPPIVWLFLIVFGLGIDSGEIGPFVAAALGLGLITAANLAEIYRGAILAVHAGQWEAAAALNLPVRSRWVDVIGPQVLRVALPSAATVAIGLLKDSAVASAIGVGEIAFQAHHASQRTAQGLGVLAIAGALYIVMSLPMAFGARWADLRLRARVGR